jgi:hypothetical protein
MELDNELIMKNKSFTQSYTVNNNKLIYIIQRILDETDVKNENFYQDYTKARKNALTYIKRKNTTIEKKLNHETLNTISFFEEKTPDTWTNGEETIKIAAIEMKSN